MRDFLTGLAIVLIVVLTTILVAPYFVDWNGQRGFLEAKLSTALGQKVTIGGQIDLKILPTPYLVLDQVVVGGDDGPIRIGVRHLDLELAVAPLLHGEFDIVEARLNEPTIRMSLEQDRSLPALPAAPAFAADVRFDRIRVTDGTLAVTDPQSGRTFVFDQLDFDADAGSFAGPFKIVGAGGRPGERTKFRLATAAPEHGRARARLVIEETDAHPGLDLDGNVELRRSDGAGRQSFDGSLVLTGHAATGAQDPVEWKLAGPFRFDPTQAVLDSGELRLGGEDTGLTLQAAAKADLGDTPKLALDLKAKQLDIDRLSGAPTESGAPPPPKLPDLPALRRILAAATPPLQTGVDLSVETATYGGETLSGIEAHLGLGDAAKQPLKISIDGPGGSHVAADGTLDDSKPSFAGTVDLAADNLPRALDWLVNVAPSVPWTGRDLLFTSVKIAGHVKVDAEKIEGDGLALKLDRSALSGTARLVAAEGARPAKLTANLEADALDLDALPSLAALRGRSNPLDVDLALDAKAAKVASVGTGMLDTGHIRLALTVAGRRIDVRQLQIDDLGGASVQATASIGPQRGRVAMTVDAANLDTAAGLVRQLFPGPMADGLVARAPSLVPAKLKIDLDLGAAPDGALTARNLAVVGNLGKTSIDAKTTPDQGDATTVSATLASPEGSALLGQLGIKAVPIATVGASRVTLSAHGHEGAPFETKLAASFGATKVDVTGRFALAASAPDGAGTFTLRSPDLKPLIQSLAIAFPDLTGRLPADLSGRLAFDKGGVTLADLKGRFAATETRGTLAWHPPAADEPAVTGALDLDRLALSTLLGLALGPEQQQPATGDEIWSRQPLASGLIDPPRAKLKLKAKTVDVLPGISAKNASLDLAIGLRTVAMDKVTADVLDGRFEGSAALRRDGKQATLEARLKLDQADLRIPGTLDARITSHLDIAGSGASAAGLVSSLGGSGEATAISLSVPRADPQALVKMFQDVEADTLAADQDTVVRAYDKTAKAPLVTRSQHFGLSLAAGILHLNPKDREKDATVESQISASLDLNRFRMEERVEEVLKALPADWKGAPPSIVVTLDGPIGKPSRSIDLSAFLNVLSSRALARESARIEAYELDVRERGFFNARLQYERHRDEERQKAEDDARKERLRREQAAKAAREAKEKAAQAKAAREAQEKAAREAQEKAREDIEKAAREPPPDTPRRNPDAPQGPTNQRQLERQFPGASDPSEFGRY